MMDAAHCIGSLGGDKPNGSTELRNELVVLNGGYGDVGHVTDEGHDGDHSL